MISKNTKRKCENCKYNYLDKTSKKSNPCYLCVRNEHFFRFDDGWEQK